MVRGGSKGRSRKTIRELSRTVPDFEQANAYITEFAGSTSPIVVAIMGVGVIETELAPILRQRLRRNDDETWASLTDENGPLATFNSKIVMAYSLGVIDEDMRDNLHIVRRIRNALAHSRILVSFNDPLIVDELARIRVPARKRDKISRRLRRIVKVPDGKEKFVCLCLDIANSLLRNESKTLRVKLSRYLQKIKEKESRANQEALVRSAGLALVTPKGDGEVS